MADADLIYELRLTIRRQAPEVFMNAMMLGYLVSDSETEHKLASSHSDNSVYTLNDWKVVDSFLHVDEASAGMTHIAYGGIPIWAMQYRGKYAHKAIPFLKSALLANYREGRWYGGRGPQLFQSEGWIYINSPDSESFENFKGEERIFDPEGNLAGWHSYNGIWMLDR